MDSVDFGRDDRGGGIRCVWLQMWFIRVPDVRIEVFKFRCLGSSLLSRSRIRAMRLLRFTIYFSILFSRIGIVKIVTWGGRIKSCLE